MKTSILLASVFSLIFISQSWSQQFVNGGLDDPGGASVSAVPPGWTMVPFTHFLCQALGASGASVDVANAGGPSVAAGIIGNPNGGSTFVSGFRGSTTSGTITWHEGIQQTVDCFIVGLNYEISFYQAVMKQSNGLDESGSWNVYIDDVLLATSAPSTSNLAFNDVNLNWELRTMTFTATATTHNFKFLPQDDDADIIISSSNVTGALRMGIDEIAIIPPPIVINPVGGPVCQNQASFNLTATPTGGTWSGTGITDANAGTFDPAVAGIGTHTITYTIPCLGNETIDIVVTNSADPTWTVPTGLCISNAPVDLSGLVTGTVGGTFSGTGITGTMFDPSVGSQTITYSVGTAPCDATLALQINVVTTADATWSAPTGLCTANAPVDLSSLVTGTAGGTFTGTGITGSMFDPSVGTQTITYSVGTAPCDDALSLQISVAPTADATWSAPTGLCTGNALVDLSVLVTGTAGGTFTGTGITGSMFDPSVGTQTITYSVGTAPCDDALSLQISVAPTADATWSVPTGLCTGNAPIDLSALVTGMTGGTFTGTGITGSMFDPSVGTQTITYSVGTAPCDDVLALQISVAPAADATWSAPTGLCTGSAPVDLSALIIGTVGGTFSGAGIIGNTFDPSFGTQTITYSVGTAPCDDALSLQVNVIPLADASWTLPTGLCTTGNPIDLSTLITGNTGGTFSGVGITGTMFDPSVGTQAITYAVGTAPCAAAITQQIIVDLPLSAGLDTTITLCDPNPNILNLSTLLNGADLGGTWQETSTIVSGQFSTTQGQLTLTGLAEGLYTFTYTQNANSNCALDVATISINYGVTGYAGLDGQVVICQDTGLIDLFSLIGGNPDTGGTWTPQTNAGNGIFDPSMDNSGTFNYTVYSSPFCPQDTSKATIDVINVANIQIIGPAELCQTNGVQAYTANVPNGTWSGQGISNQGIFNPANLNSGSATITYTFDSLGCQASTDFTIALNGVPTIEIFYDGELCDDDEQFIAPIVTNATSYFWSDGHTDLNRIIEGDYSLIDQIIQLTLTAENFCGTANEVVSINVNQCGETVYAPNAFTPDGDEFNQTFKPVLTGIDVHSYQMIIFNRWGELIFETNNLEVGWDGTYGGKVVQDGIYTWSLQYKLPNEDGNTRLIGHVNVIR